MLSQCRLLTELRLRETGRERKCIHRFANDFGSVAVIVAALLGSREAGSYSAAAAQRFSAIRILPRHPRASAIISASASSWQGLAVIRSRRLAVAGIFIGSL
jgi:hypothetical protein